MRILLLALLTLVSSQLMSQTHEFTLNNGLKILVREDHRAPVAVSMLWYHVGSADEPGGLTGVSHVLEHLMFKGTKKYPLGVFSRIIASHGGQENAFTSNDYTAYYEKIAAHDLDLSFELEADRMQHLLLLPEEFAKEIKVIQEERRMRTDNNPQSLTFERFLATAHLSAPYHHPVIGWMSDLKRMSAADAKSWYQRFYAPNNATLVVVGDVHAADVFKQAEHHFGPLTRQPAIVRKSQIEPPPLGEKQVVVRTPAQLPSLILGYTVPSVKSASSTKINDTYALELITGILSVGESGRFNKNLVHKAHLASNAETYYNLYAQYQTQFVLFGTPSQGHTLDELKQGLLGEIERLKTTLMDETELQRIKTQIIAQKTFERDSIFDQAMELGALETVGLGWPVAEQYIERINRVTPLAIQNAARQYFQTNGLTEARLIPKE